ncbi:hypothetical protein D3C86_2202450 [compost metagenome]
MYFWNAAAYGAALASIFIELPPVTLNSMCPASKSMVGALYFTPPFTVTVCVPVTVRVSLPPVMSVRLPSDWIL